MLFKTVPDIYFSKIVYAIPAVADRFTTHSTVPPIGSTIVEQQLDFTELYNRSETAIVLSDAVLGWWRIGGSLSFDFDILPIGSMLERDRILVVVSIHRSNEIVAGEFQSIYGIDERVMLVGPYGGQLENAGETVRLFAPTEPSLVRPLRWTISSVGSPTTFSKPGVLPSTAELRDLNHRKVRPDHEPRNPNSSLLWLRIESVPTRDGTAA